ncbi:hypothetical protein BDB01DRAFT_803189 [Pilobolus umbonatus]|nr:hypothetical protein BDB01DRAFT_803189 [Pilobolus umbonatus]
MLCTQLTSIIMRMNTVHIITPYCLFIMLLNEFDSLLCECRDHSHTVDMVLFLCLFLLLCVTLYIGQLMPD